MRASPARPVRPASGEGGVSSGAMPGSAARGVGLMVWSWASGVANGWRASAADLKAYVGGFSQQKRSQPGCARRNARLRWVRHPFLRGTIMLRWALFFAIVAVIAGLLGFTGIAAGAATIA